MRPKTIVYKGKTYRRQPKSKNRQHRVYYWRHDKWKQPPQSLHRQIYIDNFGPIPSGMHVHHIDHDPFNNDPANLQLIAPGKHTTHHLLTTERRKQSAEHAARIRPLAAAWHRSPVGRAWHKKHAEEQWARKRRAT